MRPWASLTLIALLAASPAGAWSWSKPKKPVYNYDALGAEFCRLSTAGDLPAMRPLITDQLATDIEYAARSAAMPPANVLFQSYTNVVPNCVTKTISAAIVQVERSAPGGPSWNEYLVIVPERDGTTRIDDVLFATRKSDTLRNRLAAYAGN